MENKRKVGLRSKKKKKNGRDELNDKVSQQFSKVNFICLFLSPTKFPLSINFYIVMANNNIYIFSYRNLVLLITYNIIIMVHMENIIHIQ